MEVDPLRCISVRKLRSRSICSWGVQMMKETILGHSNVESFIQRFVSTGKFSVLVPIPVAEQHLILDHFLEEGKSPAVAKSMSSTGPWWHVVDGGHLHGGLVLAILEFSQKVGGFEWPVVVISWQSEDKLRAISRMCNEMQHEDHLIEFTLPDAMQNLREVIDAHSKRQGMSLVPGQKVRNGFIKKVMGIYSGRSGFSDNTMRSVCGVVVKLSTAVVEGIRVLLTEECDQYCKLLGSNRPYGNDTRVYKKLLSSQSLKGVKSFLNHNAMANEDRINVIYRLRFLACERENFKSFPPAEIERQCRCVIEARNEVNKFEKFLAEDPWPSEMASLKRNMLQTTLFDGDVKEHIGAGKGLLGCMIDAYIKATGARGTQKLGLFRRRLAAEIGNGNANGKSRQNGTGTDKTCATDGDSLPVSDGVSARGGLQGQGVKYHLNEVDDRETNNEMENPSLPLEECGIHVYPQTLLEFERHFFDLGRAAEMGGTFDFIIADPFQKVPADEQQDKQDLSHLEVLVDEKGISLYVQCLRRLLVRGGYCFLFLDWTQMQQQNICCIKNQFEVVSPFIIAKDAKRVQRMTLKGLQCVYDSALVLRKPGKHPSGFNINRISPYEHLTHCRMPRWTNMIETVPPPAQRLTFKPPRALVRPNERPCELYIELFNTFCPENGKVMDPRAGTLTTGLASLATNRKCVLLELDERFLSFALCRLREFAKAKLYEEIAAFVLAEGIICKYEEELHETVNEDEYFSASDSELNEEDEIPASSSPRFLVADNEEESHDRAKLSDLVLKDQEGIINAVRSPDLMIKSQKKTGSRASGWFSDVTSEGSPSREEELHRTGKINNNDEGHRYRGKKGSKAPLASKRNRAHQTSAGLFHHGGDSPTSYRRSKRSRHLIARCEE